MPRTPSSALRTPSAQSSSASASGPSPSLPVPTSSSNLAKISQPSRSPSTAVAGSPRATPGLEPAAPILSPSPRQTPSSPSSGSSGKVIAALTTELNNTKSLLEATRTPSLRSKHNPQPTKLQQTRCDPPIPCSPRKRFLHHHPCSQRPTDLGSARTRTQSRKRSQRAW